MGDTNSTHGWWCLWVDATGSNLRFQSKSNGVLTTYFTQSIYDWSPRRDNWYQIVPQLLFEGNKSLYKMVSLQGPTGMVNYPDIAARMIYGFSIGSEITPDSIRLAGCSTNPRPTVALRRCQTATKTFCNGQQINGHVWEADGAVFTVKASAWSTQATLAYQWTKNGMTLANSSKYQAGKRNSALTIS